MNYHIPFSPAARWMLGICWLVFLLVNIFTAHAANNTPFDYFQTTAATTVSGQVLDAATNEPLIGATVTVKESTEGTTTDVDGNYTLNVPDGRNVLVVSFIGYTTQEVTLDGRANLDILLQAGPNELSQVLVIGYGSTTKREVTGSAKSVKAEDFNKGIINSPEQLLQGKVAGVNIVSATGEPGAPQSITIRGPGGVRTGSTPLFVLDGLALDNSSTGGATNPLTFLNPQDIASIDVLKDASATAIYGARGANGVVLITTKRGQQGTATVNYSGSYGISNLANPIEVFSADEFRRQVVAVGGVLEDLGANTDWQQEITRTAITQNHNVALSGGAGKMRYYGSFGLQNQEGILRKNALNLISGRVNLNQSFFDDRLSVDVNLNAANTRNVRPPFVWGDALTTNPTYPVRNADGTLFRLPAGNNPLLSLTLADDETTITRVIGSITPSVTIFKGLVYKLNFGVDYATSDRALQSFASEVPKQDGGLTTIDTKNENKLIENYLTYTLRTARHGLTALAGHSYQRIFVQSRNFSINRFPVSPIEPINNPGLGQELAIATNRPGGFAVVNELQSFFGRINYQFMDRYIVTATVRADGSSKFGANNKYGVFPSASVGWVLSEEPFLKGGIFSDLKIRAGWGQTGNQEIPSKITQALFTSTTSATSSYPLAETGPFPAGTAFVRLANPDIKWEVSNQTDIGLDFGLFNGALSGTIDVFEKVSTDILLEVIPADPVQPANTFWTNVPDMEITNRGLEVELNYQYRTPNDFRFEIGGNLTLIDNEVQGSPYSVIPSGFAIGAGLTSATINGYVNGEPIGTFFLRDWVGVDDKGVNVFRNIDTIPAITDNDRFAAGTALPNRIFNFNGAIGYKGFDLRFNFNGVSGNKIYDNTANANFYKGLLVKSRNTTIEGLGEPNESITNPAPISTRYLKDGAFLRLNNVALSYTFNTQNLGINRYIQGLTLSVTGQNLFVITDYDGYDPEVNNDRQINGITSYGIDYLSYPKARSVIFGLNVNF